MSKTILLFIGLFSGCIVSFGQASGERMLFVIDSIPLITDPEDWNPITNDDIADIAVIRNKDSLKQLGLGQLDGITYLFTKAYRNRPDSLKSIPSLKQMVQKEDGWYLHGNLYSGRYIDYYNNGHIQNEGTIVQGKLNGAVTVYFKNGTVKSVSDYRNGLLDGLRRQYYKNGVLAQQTGYTNGESNQVYAEYFYNGQAEIERKKKKATPYDTIVTYYSTGKIKQMRLIKNGVLIRNKNEEDFNYYATMFLQSWTAGNVKEMEKNFYHLWMLDSTRTDTYFNEGVLSAKEFRFDEAITAFDKVLQSEPLDRNALLQRGLARLQKHQLLQSKTTLQNKTALPLTLEDIASMPADEQSKVCHDLQLADNIDLTDYYVKKAVPEVILNYCRSSR